MLSQAPAMVQFCMASMLACLVLDSDCMEQVRVRGELQPLVQPLFCHVTKVQTLEVGQ